MTNRNRCNKFPSMSKGDKIYFIGIGGISMSSLAFMAHDAGYDVWGYDRTETAMTRRLEESGITVKYSYSPENIEGAVIAVYTSAMNRSDPELVRARELNIPLVTRAEYLGQLMLEYRSRIGVSGMHGKSTASSMLAYVYLAAELDPTVIVGAELDALGGAFRVGGRENMVFEACEYTDSFLSFYPSTAVVLNIEMDHVDYFHSMEQIITSFSRYISKAETAVVNGDDGNVKKMLCGYSGRVVTFGLSEGCDFRAVNITGAKPEFDVANGGEILAHVRLGVLGDHNVYNALAAFAAAYVNGVAVEGIVKGLEAFRGAKRRFELRGAVECGGKCMCGGVRDYEVYDDYAHHPTEIRAVLKGASAYAKERGGDLRIVYQPHTYSRTYELFDDFKNAFADADDVIFADIYAARENNEWGVSSAQLAEAVGGRYFESFAQIADYVRTASRAGDVVIVMGAGDIIGVTGLILE